MFADKRTGVTEQAPVAVPKSGFFLTFTSTKKDQTYYLKVVRLAGTREEFDGVSPGIVSEKDGHPPVIEIK